MTMILNLLNNKKMKKKEEESQSACMLLSLPHSVAVSCLAKVSRRDYAALAIASKRFWSLICSPELHNTRLLMGCTDAHTYVCLRFYAEPSPRWFIQNPNNRRLIQISSNPYQALDSSSFVVVNCGIYVIGGMINGKATCDVWFLDCLLHKWLKVPSMKVARACASTSFVDGKIYVFGGVDDNFSIWSEVFDPEKQTWETCEFEFDGEKSKSKVIHNQSCCVVLENNKVYTVDEDNQILCILPSECTISTNEKTVSKKHNDWCVINNLLYCRGSRGKLLWCDPHELDWNWKEVKGCGPKHNPKYVFELSSLCSNSDGNIVVFWSATKLKYDENLEIWSAEISLERREGGEIWGKVDWAEISSAVMKLITHAFGGSWLVPDMAEMQCGCGECQLFGPAYKTLSKPAPVTAC